MKKLFVLLFFVFAFSYGFCIDRGFSFSVAEGGVFYDNDNVGWASQIGVDYQWKKWLGATAFIGMNYAKSYPEFEEGLYRGFYYSDDNWSFGAKINLSPVFFKSHMLNFFVGYCYNIHPCLVANGEFEIDEEGLTNYDSILVPGAGDINSFTPIVGANYFYQINRISLGLEYDYQKYNKLKEYGTVLQSHQLFLIMKWTFK